MADDRIYAAGATGIGILFLWSALRNKSVLGATQAAIRGTSPTTAASLPETSPSIPSQVTSVIGGTTGTPPTVKGAYTHSELMALWIAAGGNPAAANNAACHAIQESSGNPGVTSRNPDGGTNVGLWQLDTPGGKGAGYSIAQLQNPVTNARVAVKGSSNGSDWSAWATPGC
jgi:hypothetical protein